MLVALAVGSVTERLTLTRDESKVLEFIESIRNTQVHPAPPFPLSALATRDLASALPACTRKRQPVCQRHPVGRGGKRINGGRGLVC